MPDPRPWDVLLVNGATRIPITLATDTGGRLAYQVDDETQGEKERLLWEQGEFTGGLGQQFVRDPTRYLMANNVDAARDQGFRLSPLITYTDQGASPYTVRAGTPEIRSGECRPIAFDEDTVISVSSGDASVQVGARIRVEVGTGHGIVLRLSDASNYWSVRLNQASSGSANALQLEKLVAGSPTVVATANITVTAGTTYLLQATCSGDVFNVYVDGTLRIGPTTDAFNNTATHHGLRFNIQTGTMPGVGDWWVEGFLYDGFDGSANGTALTSHRPTFNGGMVNMRVFGGSLYLCDGLSVYRFSAATGNWLHRFIGTRPTETLKTLFDMAVYGANLYVSRGSSSYWYSADGDTWTESTFALSWWPYAFTMLRDTFFGVSAENQMRSSTTPTNGGSWSSVIASLGDSSVDTNDAETWADLVVVGKDDGVWTTDITGLIYHMTPALRTQANDANARGLLAGFDGSLLVPLAHRGLWQLDLDGQYEDISLRRVAPSLMTGVGALNSLQANFGDVRLVEDAQWLYAAMSGYVLRGRKAGRGWVWQGFLTLFDPSSLGADDVDVVQPFVTTVPYLDAPLLWFQEPNSSMGSGKSYRIGWVELGTENRFATPSSATQQHSMVTSGWDGGPGRRHLGKGLHRVGVFARNLAAARPLRVDYATDVYNGVPSSWTQCQNSSGSATTITADGYSEVYFAANTSGRNVFLRFTFVNNTSALTPEVLWFTLYGRVQQDERRQWVMTARLSRGARGGRQSGGMADPGGILSNLRTARNTATPSTLTDLDGTTTYRVDVVSVRVLSTAESTRLSASGQDRFVQIVCAEAVAN